MCRSGIPRKTRHAKSSFWAQHMHFATNTEALVMLFDAFIASPEETLLRLERAVEVSCTSAMGGVDDAVRALRAARDSTIKMYGSAARLASKQLDRQREEAKQLCSGLKAVANLCAAAGIARGKARLGNRVPICVRPRPHNSAGGLRRCGRRHFCLP